MAKFTINILADNSKAMQSVAEIQKKLNDIERNPIEIKIDAIGDTEVLKLQTKLEQARASTARANAKIAESEAKVKIARQQTKTATAQATLEEKKAETAKKQSTLETKKAARVEKEREVAIERGNTALKNKELQEERTKTKVAETTLVQEKAKAAAEKRADAEHKATSATKELGEATEKTAQKAETLWDNFQKFARWYIIGNAFSGIVRSMREALDTMKAVDDELVTIRKVTGFSNEQIAGIREQAYSTASAYGVGAADYLGSVAAFSRAGYKEQSAALAELSTKTQIVGDTTAEVANQFLLSTDAAYKYHGSISELNRVLDGANEIDNKYATSIEKIASGMGIVAPVAAQMHVSVDELTAAIGTITAVTQRSGTEAARALRALFLNIAGDTKTEIDEGVTWTTGEIAGLRDVIKLYAKDAYEAAQATGSIIDPMKAMEGLAKSMADGVLSEQKLIEMVSDIGGKLRTSQLLAIIQNWDMYQSMLQDYAGAIGSADKEVDNALDSWTRKTNQLKNAWTEFVSHLIETNQIKSALDLLTGAVQLLDSSFGRAAVTAGLFFAALKVTGALNGVITLISGLITTISGLTTATELFSAVWAASPFFVIAVAAAGIYGIAKAVDALNVTYDEHKEKLEQIQKQYDSMYGAGSEYDDLKSREEDLLGIERERLIVLEGQAKQIRDQLDAEKKATALAWRSSNSRVQYSADPKTGTLNVDFVSKTGDEVNALSAAFDKLTSKYLAAEIGTEGYREELQKLAAEHKSSVEGIRLLIDAGEELTDDEWNLLRVYSSIIDYLGKKTEAEEDDTGAMQENADATGDVAGANETLKTALEEVDKNGSLTRGTLAQLEALYPGLSRRILDANGNLTEEGRAAMETRASLLDLISSMISANATALTFDSQIAELQRLAEEAGIAAGMISAVFSSANMLAGGTGDWDIIGDMTPDELAQYRLDSVRNQTMALVRKQIKDKELISPPGGGGGGSTEDARLKELQSIVSLRKQELSFLDASGASAEDQAAKMREIQAALHDQAEYLRTIEGESANVKALSTEWWSIQKKIADATEKAAKALQDEELNARKEDVALLESELDLMEARGASYDDQIAKIRQIQQALDNQISTMRRFGASEREINELLLKREKLESSILDIKKKEREETVALIEAQIKQLDNEKNEKVKALKAQLDALKKQKDEQDAVTTLAEKELAVRQALEALENARRERTVRQYNAKAGQWEWVADPKTIRDAEKAWEDAKKAVKEYKDDAEYQKKIDKIQGQIDATEQEYDTLKDALQSMIDELNNTTTSISKINSKYKKIINDLSGSDLNFKAKLEAIFGSDALSDSTKDIIAEALKKMLGTTAGKSAAELFTDYINNALKTHDPEQAIKELCDAINNGVVTDLNDVAQILKALNGDYEGISISTAKLWALTKMQANSIAWHMTSDAATKAALHAENEQLGKAVGLTYNSSTGTWHDASGQQAYTLDGVIGGSGMIGMGGTSSSGSGSGKTYTWTDPSTGQTYEIDGDTPTVNPLTGEVMAPATDNRTKYAKTYQEPVIEYDEQGNVKSYTVVDQNGNDFTVTNRSVLTKLEMIRNGEKPERGTMLSNYEFEPMVDDDGHIYMWAHGTTDKTADVSARFFDRGGIQRGILHGTGAIKATASDEMILPPDATRALINAENNGAFDALLNHLGIVTAEASRFAGFSGGMTRNSIGSQHNGDIVNINGIELRNITESTTLGEIVRQAKNLALQRGS